MEKTYVTEASVVAGILGGCLMAGAQVIPVGYETMGQWLTFIGTILLAAGGSGIGYRISKKQSP